MCSYCDTIAIHDTENGYELIWTQLSTNRFLSPRPSESAHSYTHRVCNGLTIAANVRTLIWTTLYWGQMYSDLQLSSFAIYRTESILHLSRHMNPKSHSPRHRERGRTEGWFISVHSVDMTLIYRLLFNIISVIWPCISQDAMVVWYWRHHISLGTNHSSMSR